MKNCNHCTKFVYGYMINTIIISLCCGLILVHGCFQLSQRKGQLLHACLDWSNSLNSMVNVLWSSSHHTCQMSTVTSDDFTS